MEQVHNQKDHREHKQQVDGSACDVKDRPYDQPSHQQENEKEQKDEIRQEAHCKYKTPPNFELFPGLAPASKT